MSKDSDTTTATEDGQTDGESSFCIKDLGCDPPKYVLYTVKQKWREKHTGGGKPVYSDITTSLIRGCVPQAPPQLVSSVLELAVRDELEISRQDDPLPSLFTSVSQLLATSQLRFLSLSCPLLDRCLGGGLRHGVVTELTGESGSGKTQFCLHATVEAVLQGGTVLYLQTRNQFPSSRLEQILRARVAQDADREKYRDRVLIQRLVDFHHAEAIINNQVEKKVGEGETTLLVLDSITALVRGDVDVNNILERSSVLHRLGGGLNSISRKYDVAVLIVNHVTDSFGGKSPATRFRKVIPALGSVWPNYIHNRLFLTKTDLLVSRDVSPLLSGLVAENRLRTLQVDISPHLPHTLVNFIIKEDGLQGIRVVH